MHNLNLLLKKIASQGAVLCLKLLRFLPLPIIHALGTALGFINYLFNHDHRAHAERNLKQCGLSASQAEL